MSYWGNSQPPLNTPIDWSHPLSRNLVGVFLAGGDGFVYDGILSRVSNKAATIYKSPKGIALGDWLIPASNLGNLQFNTGSWTIAAFFHQNKANSNGEYPSVFGKAVYVNESSNGGWDIGSRPPDASPNPGQFTVGTFANNISTFTITGVGTNGAGDHFLLQTCDGAGTNPRLLYLDNSSTVTSHPTIFNPVVTSGVNLVNGSSGTTQCPMYVGYCWKRTMNTSEVDLIMTEPYCIYAPPVLPITRFWMTGPSSSSINLGLSGGFTPMRAGFRD